MVIDKGKLIAMLVEKTGRSKEEVEGQLAQLVSRIQETAQSGRQFNIEGFGTFGMDEGMIYFDPASRLKTEINQKYAGMKPIELMAAFKETGAGVPVEELEDKPQARMAPPPPDAPAPPMDEPADEPGPDTEEEPPVAKPEAAAEPEPRAEKSEREEQTKKPKPQKKAAPTFVAESQRRETMGSLEKALIGFVILIVLLVGGWLLYESGLLSSADTAQRSGAAPVDTTRQQMNQPVPATIDTAAADSSAVGGASSSPFGLKGDVNRQVGQAFTIVIHSFRLRSTVEEIADSLNNLGYRTVLFEGEPNGNTRWRLGLGQFKSLDAAQQALKKLPEKYRNNHFITQIN